ncbi:MAG: hypothetical protein ACT4O9_06490 [Blastocatellia bacterium]
MKQFAGVIQLGIMVYRMTLFFSFLLRFFAGKYQISCKAAKQ